MTRPLLFLTALTAIASAQQASDHYRVEPAEVPAGVVGEIGGISVTPSGKLAVAFYREGVFFYDPATKAWSHFAHGLHEPLGIHAVSESEVVVMQRPELTRITDTDGDGAADSFETLCDDFGMSGNYHEFAYGPAVGPDGAFYIGLNTASSGDGIYDEVRGELRKDGRPGRMYACVPYRGWILRVDPETGEMTPWASGFRSPNGIGFDAAGNLLAPDNQGDWVGTSPVHVVQRDAFHGHAASLLWTKGWDRGVPKDVPVAELAKLRRRPAIQMPHGVLSNSPCQVLPDTTGGKFGPFTGQTLVGEMNHAHIIRLMLEEVGGEFQGAATTLFKDGGLARGVSRMAFDSEGALWVGHDKRDKGWGRRHGPESRHLHRQNSVRRPGDEADRGRICPNIHRNRGFADGRRFRLPISALLLRVPPKIRLGPVRRATRPPFGPLKRTAPRFASSSAKHCTRATFTT